MSVKGAPVLSFVSWIDMDMSCAVCRWFLSQSGMITLMEMLQQSEIGLLTSALQLLNAIVANDTRVLESLCLIGIVPIVNGLAGVQHAPRLRDLAASFVEQLCSTSELTVQMFVACGGLPVLVGVRDYTSATQHPFFAFCILHISSVELYWRFG
jgi:hypothetical protein